MRVRRQNASGDYTFGHGSKDFIADQPAAVAQLLSNTLAISEGTWYLDVTFGTPWWQKILGYTTAMYDAAIKDTILSVNGVTGLTNYTSYLDAASRGLTVTGDVQTIYGSTEVTIPVTTGVRPTGYVLAGDGSYITTSDGDYVRAMS
jgi:hypothetical protein